MVKFSRKVKMLAGITSVFVSLNAPATAHSLNEALISAYNSSGLLEQNRAVLRAADEDVAQAMASLGPVINWSASMQRSISRGYAGSNFVGTTAGTTATVGLSLTQLLYDGGRSALAVEQRKEAVLSSRQSLVSVEQNVLLSAVQAFMDVRRYTETVALRENNLRVIREELRAAQDRFDVGEVTKTDVALAEARLAASQSALAAAKGNLAQANEYYKQTVGGAAHALDAPRSLPRLPKSAQAAKQLAVRNHPDIKKLQHDVKASELGVRAAAAYRQPNVSVGGQLQASDQISNDTSSLSASVSLQASGPVYASGRYPSITRQAQQRSDAARSALHVAVSQIEQQAGSAFSILEVARAGRAASEQQIRAATVAFRGIREEATLGSRTTLDVLNAEQELLDARAGLISAIADENIAAYRLLAATGQLTVDHLNLPVQKYDPAAYYNMVKDTPTATSKQGKQLDKLLRSLNK